jgi:cyclopropane-fatty-acyl-phospholipid synthase
LWDGSLWPAAGERAACVLHLTHPGALRRMLGLPLDLHLGESFIRGDFEVEGDLEAALRVADRLEGAGRRPREFAALVHLIGGLPRAAVRDAASLRPARLSGVRHSRERDRQAITHHYDVGNEFFRLWLDRRMVYSCAYFERPDDDLDAAQEAKLDLVCRKLRLQPGERLVDIGCGWAGLVMHAAERWGVSAVGINLSAAQIDLGRRRVAEAHLEDRCRIELRDYRELERAAFDKAASVGMFEHVGKDRLVEYFGAAFQALRPGGLFLNHGIATGRDDETRGFGRRPSFIDRYVFPDGELVSISDALAAAEKAGFEVRDVESLREHYAMTLRHWVRRLEQRQDEAIRAVGAATYRTWRLFMAASAHGFATGRLYVYQAVLEKPRGDGSSALPLTRADLYSRRPGS